MHPPPEPADVAIVGAGAAGLATAIFAARRNPGRRIVLLDGAAKPGAKILVSGGGRCNVTNVAVSERDYWGGNPNVVRRVLRSFPNHETVEFFREIGVPLHEEQWGKLFPDSNQARTVLDALLGEARDRGVEFRFGSRVTALRPAPGGFDLEAAPGFRARKVVLATGGLSLPKTGSDGGGYALARSLGHSIVPTTQALAPLVLDRTFHAALSGLSLEVELSIHAGGEKVRRISGPMLWTHFGISGPAALDASRHVLRARLEGRPVRVAASFLPGTDFESLDRELVEAARRQPNAKAASALAARLPERLAIALAPDEKLGRLSKEARRKFVHDVLEWPVPVRDGRGWNYAEVTAGGVPLSELDPSNLESRLHPGLHFVGEILDVDGRIGGFNFQWAWASGKLVGESV